MPTRRLPSPSSRVVFAILAATVWDCTPKADPGDRATHVFIDPEQIFAGEQMAMASCSSSDAVSCETSRFDQCSLSGTNYGAGDYGCQTPEMDLDGSEWLQPLTVDQDGDVVITATNASAYPFIVVLRDKGAGVDPSDCVRGDWYSVRLQNGVDVKTGDKLFVVVDHPDDGADVAFNLRVECAAPQNELDCQDTFDGDGDYLKDCRDPDCMGGSACPICSSTATLSCGDQLIPGDTAAFGAQDLFDSYACLLGLVPSSWELAYTFVAPASEEVVFTVSHANRYPLLAVLEDTGNGCMSGDCLTGNYYSVRFAAQAGKTYYLLVDALEGPTFNYTVSLLCNAPPQEVACADDIDEDGDHLTDCQDEDCVLDPVCNTNPCVSVATIDCGTRLLSGNTGGPFAHANVNEYSCMPFLDFGHSEVTYELLLSSGPAERDVLVSLSNTSHYAAVAVLGDITVTELDVTIENTTSENWSAGLLALQELIAVGPTPQPGEPAYATYAYAHRDCDFADSFCSGSCDDDGLATVLLARLGLTLDQDAFVVPALAPGESATVRILAPASAELSYITRIVGSTDDLMAMHVVDDPSDLSVPLADEIGEALTTLSFAISGYDVNSRNRNNGNRRSCNPNCPTATSGCYVAMNNGTTGGNQDAQAVASETRCSPEQCVAGNYYGARFTAVRDRSYWVVVEGSHQPAVSYDLTVICDPPADESLGGCFNGFDDDGDYLSDCDDPDCDSACALGDLCQPTVTIDCSTLRLSASTGDPNATQNIGDYPCQPALEVEGAELTYRFVAETTGWVAFTTSGRSDYAAVIVLEDTGTCDPFHCLAANYYTGLAHLEAGKSYFVVVDGIAGTVDYELSVLCDPPTVESDCGDGLDNDGDAYADCDDLDCDCP